MNDGWLTSSHPSRQSCDRRLLPISTSAANAGRGGSLHDAEPLGWTGEEASHAAMSQHAKLPQRHLPVHAALQALIQCKWKKAAQSTSVHKKSTLAHKTTLISHGVPGSPGNESEIVEGQWDVLFFFLNPLVFHISGGRIQDWGVSFVYKTKL